MSRGDEIEDAYLNFGSNDNDVVMIAVNCAPNQTKQQMISAYGFTPKFPIILGPKGKEISDEYGNPNASGGPTWIFHPKKPKSSATYHTDPALHDDIQAAIDDDCNNGTTFSLVVTNGSGDGDHAKGASIIITADAAPSGKEFDKWTGDTGYLADPNSSTTTVTMPAQDITVTATYKDKGPIIKKDNFMVISSWEAGVGEQGSSVTIDSSQKADTILSASMDLKTSDETNSKWAWAKISGYADGNFTGVTSVELVYYSNNPVNLVLDQEGLSLDGESYLYQLPAASRGKITIQISDFAQPNWVADADKTPLDLSKVQSVSFAAVNEGAVTDIEIQGIYLNGFQETPIINCELNLTKNIMAVSSLTSNQLVVRNVLKGNYNILIYNTAGKKILDLNQHLNGRNIIDFKSTKLTNGAYIVKISGNSGSIIANKVIK